MGRVQEELSEIKQDCVVESYGEMVDKWGIGETVWEKLIHKDGVICHTWNITTDREGHFRLLHATPSHKPSPNPHCTQKKYRTPSVDASGHIDEGFLYEALDMIYTRCDPPTNREDVKAFTSGPPRKTNSVRGLMQDVFQE